MQNCPYYHSMINFLVIIVRVSYNSLSLGCISVRRK